LEKNAAAAVARVSREKGEEKRGERERRKKPHTNSS
jgi:hypothetical protein